MCDHHMFPDPDRIHQMGITGGKFSFAGVSLTEFMLKGLAVFVKRGPQVLSDHLRAVTLNVMALKEMHQSSFLKQGDRR